MTHLRSFRGIIVSFLFAVDADLTFSTGKAVMLMLSETQVLVTKIAGATVAQVCESSINLRFAAFVIAFGVDAVAALDAILKNIIGVTQRLFPGVYLAEHVVTLSAVASSIAHYMQQTDALL
jgi:hypothetical protein